MRTNVFDVFFKCGAAKQLLNQQAKLSIKFRVYTKWCWWWFFNTIFCIHKISSQCYKMKLYQHSWIYHSHLRFRLTLRDIHRWFARLPENLCFGEFRSVNSTMSFICCDAEGSHDIVAILENRLTKTIRELFMNRYTNQERAAVKSVVVDLNAQYIKFIKALFPNARIIIDRFHIV